jgi:hypothetical protein
MGQAKDRGTFNERKLEGEFKRAMLKQKFDAWNEEVAAFRKTFGLDIGIISGAPPGTRIVVVDIDKLRAKLLGFETEVKAEEAKVAPQKESMR